MIRAKLANPTHPQTQENLAQLAAALNLTLIEMLRQHSLRMIQQRHYTDAVEALSLVIEDLPADVEAYKSLAVALNALGRLDEAFMIWQACQQMTGLSVQSAIA